MKPKGGGSVAEGSCGRVWCVRVYDNVLFAWCVVAPRIEMQRCCKVKQCRLLCSCTNTTEYQKKRGMGMYGMAYSAAAAASFSFRSWSRSSSACARRRARSASERWIAPRVSLDGCGVLLVLLVVLLHPQFCLVLPCTSRQGTEPFHSWLWLKILLNANTAQRLETRICANDINACRIIKRLKCKSLRTQPFCTIRTIDPKIL